MPGIFNVENTYNANNKRISNKLTFNTGEKFSGKIIEKEGSDEATICLIDGWEFQAEIDGELESLGKGLTRFQVEGFENIKNSINETGEKNKEILKELLVSIENEGVSTDKILDVLKNNINEIKLFNKISSEYYYADIPINIKDRDYPCKIIVKDKREDSKKIDSKNVKMVIIIDTKNLGIVDGYMKVLDKKIDIDLKCEEGYVNIIDMAKNKLLSNIENMGFIVDIRVSKKEEEVSITTCRDFFNFGFGVSIDRRV